MCKYLSPDGRERFDPLGRACCDCDVLKLVIRRWPVRSALLVVEKRGIDWRRLRRGSSCTWTEDAFSVPSHTVALATELVLDSLALTKTTFLDAIIPLSLLAC